MKQSIRGTQTVLEDISAKSGAIEYAVEAAGNLTLVLLLCRPDTSADVDVVVRLTGRGAYAKILGLILVRGKNSVKLRTMQQHSAPGCTSDLLVKTALYDSSSCVVDGAIRVEKGAQKTDAYQRNENLLLSDTADAESKPSLEILADDVRCTHGATVSPISNDELWYLKTRGISGVSAEKLIVRGFFQKSADTIEDAAVKETVMNLLTKVL